jgi:hypothetical protein
VARLLANDFIYVGNDGSIATNAEFLPSKDDIKHRPLKLLEWSLLKYNSTAIQPWPFIPSTKKAMAKESFMSSEAILLLPG